MKTTGLIPVMACAALIATALPGIAVSQEARPGCNCAELCACQGQTAHDSINNALASAPDVRVLPCEDLTADVFLSLFEPEYYRSLPDSEHDLLSGENIDDLPSIRLGYEDLPGSALGAWMEATASDDGSEFLEPHFSFGPMVPGNKVHARLVVYNNQTGQVICNEVYTGAESLEISRTISMDDSAECYSAVVVGYAEDDGVSGVPVFRMLTPEK